jgi:protein phosphatase
MAEPFIEALPDDALVLLVGPSGAGKSTWATSRFKTAQVLSSDTFRYWVAGDATDQSANADAFKVLHTVARARLRRGLLTVVDATNLTRRARRSLLTLADRERRPTVAIAFDVTLERCLAQNAARTERHVPEDVVARHVREMAIALEQLPAEGYADVHIVRDAEMDGA